MELCQITSLFWIHSFVHSRSRHWLCFNETVCNCCSFQRKIYSCVGKGAKNVNAGVVCPKNAIGRKPSVIILEADCKEERYWCRSVLLHSQMWEWLSTFIRFAVIEIVLSNWSTSWIFSVVYGLQLRKGNKLFAATRKGTTYTPWVENCGRKTRPWWNY